LVTQNIQTDTAIAIDVGMVYFGGKIHLQNKCELDEIKRNYFGWLEGIVCGKVDE